MTDHYPAYQYVHQMETNPLQAELVSLVLAEREQLLQIREGRFTRSQDVERALLPALSGAGFLHSVTNRQIATLFSAGSDFELDFFQPDHRIALEIEKGKHFNVWRDVCKFAESTLVDHAVLMIPSEKSGERGQSDQIFLGTVDGLTNITRLYQGLKSLLVIGY